MEKLELREFNKTLAALYNKSFADEGELAILFELYQPYSLREMQAALKDYMRNKSFYPKPAELIRIADENRRSTQRAEMQEAEKAIRYDSNGRRIYKCPYCQDSGYMIVDDDRLYSPSATKCICQHAIKSAEYKRNGRVRLRLKSKHRRSDNYYVFDPTRRMFVREDEFDGRQSARQPWVGDMDSVTAAMLEQTELPF